MIDCFHCVKRYPYQDEECPPEIEENIKPVSMCIFEITQELVYRKIYFSGGTCTVG